MHRQTGDILSVSVKIWSQYLQYLQSYLENFIRHLAAAVPLLVTQFHL